MLAAVNERVRRMRQERLGNHSKNKPGNTEWEQNVRGEESEVMKVSKSSTKSPRRERAVAVQAETLEWHSRRRDPRPAPLLLPGSPCPAFSLPALMEDGQTEKVFSQESFQADYVVVLFLPMESSADSSELAVFGAEVELLRSLDCQVVGVAGDSILSIRQWAPGCGFPVLSDKGLELARAFGARRPSGMVARGTFLLGPERRVRHCSLYPRSVARSPDEVVRQVAAAKELAGSEQAAALPAGWQPGDEPLPTTEEGRRELLGTAGPGEEEEGGEVGPPELFDFFSHVRVDAGGPRDLLYFLQGI